jgi:RNA polymerase sigma factor (sigma-70 family)
MHKGSLALVAGWGRNSPQMARMTEDGQFRRGMNRELHPAHPLEDCTGLLEWLFAESGGARWEITRQRFGAVLDRSAQKLFASGLAPVTQQRLEEYLKTLHLQDLALATACADGHEAAWEQFVSVYRPYLRSSAAAILGTGAGSAEASELADSLFAELYGIESNKGAERSLFRYFHGRSSLRTWLRAVLSQRHIDSLRAHRRFKDLAPEDGAEKAQPDNRNSPHTPPDPHRERYISLFTQALKVSLDQLEPAERQRLRLYYAEEKTLAEIGRCLGEHESSASRHLERTRKSLRSNLEEKLRRGFGAVDGSPAQPGLSEPEIALCFEYATEDVPIDLAKLLPSRPSAGPGDLRKGPGSTPARNS